MTVTWEPTTDQILDLDGVRRRTDGFRFELCDRDYNPSGELHPDRAQSVPSVENDTTNSTSRRLRGLKLLPDEAADVNVVRDRLRVYQVLQNGVEFRLGSFLWADASHPVRSWGNEQHSELVDPSYILGQPSSRPYGWSRGAGPLGVIMIFLASRAGFGIADIAVIGPEASRSLAEPMSWEPGATWTQMLTDLGNLCGFAPPWFDRDGRMHLDQPPDPDLDQPTVTYDGAGARIVADSIVRSSDLLMAPNDFAVFDSGTDRLRVGRYQLPASAPHSFANRGFRVGLVESVQGLESQAQADKAARNLARTRSVSFEWLAFASTADPRHDTYDVVEALGARWLETSWSLELRSGGSMAHTLRRTSYDL